MAHTVIKKWTEKPDRSLTAKDVCVVCKRGFLMVAFCTNLKNENSVEFLISSDLGVELFESLGTALNMKGKVENEVGNTIEFK